MNVRLSVSIVAKEAAPLRIRKEAPLISISLIDMFLIDRLPFTKENTQKLKAAEFELAEVDVISKFKRVTSIPSHSIAMKDTQLARDAGRMKLRLLIVVGAWHPINPSLIDVESLLLIAIGVNIPTSPTMEWMWSSNTTADDSVVPPSTLASTSKPACLESAKSRELQGKSGKPHPPKSRPDEETFMVEGGEMRKRARGTRRLGLFRSAPT
jgi:hypothetical protein